MLKKITNLLIFTTLFGITMYNVSVSESQEIDDKFIPFLPTESEIPGYTFMRQMNFIWQVEEGVTQDIIRQIWHNNNDAESEARDFYIEVCIFNTIPEAIKKTTNSSRTWSTPYEWGSVSGSINGDHSWYASYNKAPSQYIVRGNVGVRIVSPTELEHVHFADVVNVMLSKIEKNLDEDVLMSEQESKKKQIDLSKYRQLSDPVLALNETKEFTFLKQLDSKWVIDENTYAAGIRSEWKNEQGAIIGIDICEFEKSDDSRSAMELQALYTHGKIFNMEDMTTFETHIDRWRKVITPYKYFNAISVYDKLAVHLYQYDPEKKPNTNIFRSVAYKLVDQISF